MRSPELPDARRLPHVRRGVLELDAEGHIKFDEIDYRERYDQLTTRALRPADQ
ncbi:hypothetical protein ACFRMN_09270 [Streptomyces sp. NPDC056835]|uniref:hypothetical protein n=1 Tax=Streptomyces sp. NPDC056835 TaxID=3345956 RepID=UPI003691114A